MTLRRKFVVALAAVAALVAVVIGVFSYSVTAHNLHGEVDRSLAAAAATLATGGTLADGAASPAGQPVPGSGHDNDVNRDGIDQGLVQAARKISPSGAVTVVLGKDIAIPVDATVLGLAASSAPPGALEYQVASVDGSTYRVLTQALGGGSGAVQVARDLGETSRVLTDLAVATALVGLGVVIVAAAGGWFLARQLTRGLVGLTEVAEQVSSTSDLGVRFPAPGRDEVGRLSASLQRMLAQLAHARDDQQRLVQDAGHELRTPLTSLRTNVSVLRRFAELSPGSRRRLLDDVDGETRELTNLVNELVELASDRHDDQPAQPVDLPGLAERVAERFRRRSGRTIVVDAEPGTVAGHPRLIERALSNLLDNAVKFDPSGSAPILVRVRGSAIEVMDRGPGVTAQDADRLFDRFYRATAARSLPGSGLGLAIVHDIAVQHGGQVWATPRPGGGAVIGFSLGSAELLPESKPEPIVG